MSLATRCCSLAFLRRKSPEVCPAEIDMRRSAKQSDDMALAVRWCWPGDRGTGCSVAKWCDAWTAMAAMAAIRMATMANHVLDGIHT